VKFPIFAMLRPICRGTPMKRIIFAITLLSASSLFAQDFWEKYNRDFSINPKDHALCYQVGDGPIQGSNVDRKVTLASVSKMVTTYWALNQKGYDYQYETKFLVKGKKLHITGSLDPVFSSRKLFYLVSQFNKLGIHELEEITFDENFRVFTKAEQYAGTTINVTPVRTAANLKDFLHTPDWNLLKAAYKDFIATTPNSVIETLGLVRDLKDLDLKVGKVSFVETAPFSESDSEVQTYTHRSPEIEKYLKYQNIVSNNYFADQIFNKLGGEVAFDQFFDQWMKDNLPDYKEQRVGFSDSDPSLKMYTGSGLDSVRDGKRVDNYSSCSVIMTIMKKMDQQLIELEREIQKSVAVPGVDQGTFRARLNSPRIARTMIAKTGTLMHTSSLTGILSTVKGKVAFGIFHQMTGAKGNAKIVQDKVVDKLFELNDGSVKFDYKPEFFFPAYEELR